MHACVVQTADSERYKTLLDITAPAGMRFCHNLGLPYIRFVGIKRGVHPWHAAFNRIIILSELLSQGHTGWVVYLDADAYPFDLHFDLAGYLTVHDRWGIIAAPGGHASFMPNSGILLLNFAQPAVRDVVRAWQSAFDEQWPDARLAEATDWVGNGDQDLLHHILHQRGDSDSLVKLESFTLIGWPASRLFRQVLRQFGTFEERCKSARQGVAKALLTSNVGVFS
jgi:hypothetical protein